LSVAIPKLCESYDIQFSSIAELIFGDKKVREKAVAWEMSL
jgi:hypothetical protein